MAGPAGPDPAPMIVLLAGVHSRRGKKKGKICLQATAAGHFC